MPHFSIKSILFLFLLFWVVSCKTRKQKKEDLSAIKEVEKPLLKESYTKNIVSDVINAKNKTEFLFFNAEAYYKDEKINQTINIELQAHQNNYIWLNAKVLFVNVARILITPDSIKIIDYLNRQYISASYNYINKYSSVPMQFQQLQNLVFGNLLFEPTEENIYIDSNAAELLLRLMIDKSYQQSIHEKNTLKPSSIKLKDETNGRTFDVEYANFKTDGNNKFPQKIVIHIQAEKKVDCIFTISNLATSKVKEPQFAIPKTYKVLVY